MVGLSGHACIMVWPSYHSHAPSFNLTPLILMHDKGSVLTVAYQLSY